jgi:hypothetical protein
MPGNIESKATEPIGGIDLALAKRHLADVQRAIAAINYSDVWQHIGMVIKCGDAHIDTKKPAKGKGINLKLQVKGKGAGEGCVANITVDEKLRKYLNGGNKQMKHRISQMVRIALQQSLNTGWQMKVEDKDEGN